MVCTHLEFDVNLETMSSAKKLTILVVPVPNAVGHANACAGATRSLLERGHRVIMFIAQQLAGKFTAQGFEERLFNENGLDTERGSAGESMAKALKESGLFGKLDARERVDRCLSSFTDEASYDKVMRVDQQLVPVIQEIQPDLFVVDDFKLLPAIHYSGIPWIQVISAMPLYALEHPDLPPAFFGKARLFVFFQSFLTIFASIQAFPTTINRSTMRIETFGTNGKSQSCSTIIWNDSDTNAFQAMCSCPKHNHCLFTPIQKR